MDNQFIRDIELSELMNYQADSALVDYVLWYGVTSLEDLDMILDEHDREMGRLDDNGDS